MLAGMLLALAALGIAAGALTSLAGQGGGLLLLLVCSQLVGPHAALAMTAPALLLGNLHRSWLYRRSIDRPIAARMMMGSLPGALAGVLASGGLPASCIDAALVVMTALALAKAAGWVRFVLPAGALAPAGFGIGAMTGTAGGAGVLLSPVLLSAGLGGAAYVGTASAVSAVTHVGRVIAYGAIGLFATRGGDDTHVLASAAALAVAIFAGNALAERMRVYLSRRTTTWIEHVTLIACVALSVVGMG